MASEQQYISLFETQRALIEAHSCEAMNARREAALSDLRRTGLPSQRQERYKYTDIEGALAPDYGLNLKQLRPSAAVLSRIRCNVPNLSRQLACVANDTFVSGPQEPMAGLTVASLRQAGGTTAAQVVQQHYGRLASTADDGLTALNTLLAQDGVLVHVAANAQIDEPVQVIQLSAAATDLMANRRVLVVVEAGARVKLLFCDHADTDHRYLTTQVTEVVVGAGASVELYTVEETAASHTRLANLYIEQAEGSSVLLGGVTLHCGLSRSLTDVRLAGPGATVEAFGAVVGDGRQHIDQNILVDHASPDCRSHLLYKYVLDEQAVGAFAGRVLVRPGAQRTDSQQTNANLCASPKARMYTQPMLEIYADDVKCNHGSTVGRFDEQSLFYMCQRGIPEAEARLLLQHAFVNEVLEHIRLVPLRDRLSYLVEKRFRGELDKCANCKLCGSPHELGAKNENHHD